MTLEGGKLICLDEAGNHGEVVLAKGRKFTMGYYVNCDYVMVDERAKGIHCEIECDAFGRVTIRNLSPDKPPLLVNGSSVEIKRILLNNSKLSILGKDYLWIFPKSTSNEFEDLPVQDASTPQKLIGIAEQPPSSCPDFKLHRDLPKRFTVHNFAYCIQSDEEGNTSSESNEENENASEESKRSQIEKQPDIQTTQLMEKDSKCDTSPEKDSDKEKENLYRCITPDPNEQLVKVTTEPLQTPKMNLINCTKDKENSSTQKENKQLLKMCHQSDIVITSFSPRETGVKICKSFATVVKPKTPVAKPPATPKSAYSTPKSYLHGKDPDDTNQSDLIAFYTPSTSKKVSGSATILPKSAKVLKNSSMHLIDLTTPSKVRPASSHLKPELKASAKKNVSFNVDKSCIKLSSEQQLGLTALPVTPVVTSASNMPLEATSSIITIDSSVEHSSVIELTSDGSTMGLTPSIPTDLNTPIKVQTRAGMCTPKGTPQSLMKRAILTSAKKQNTTPLKLTQNPTTPRREPINRIPLRSNLAPSKTVVSPQVLAGSSSTPILKHSTQRHFDLSPSTSNIVSDTPSTSTKSFSRRSSLNPISATKALPTSTPVSRNSLLRNRVVCKTSPLHKVRKSLGGVPLSSHIFKARKSIALSALSSSKILSVKEKSPQQVMSARLVSRARKSVNVTSNSSRSLNLVVSAKTPLQPTCHSSIQIEQATVLSTNKPECKSVLFANKNTEDESGANNLSRTFILHSSEEESMAVKKDATFSPEKQATVKKEDSPAIEIPVDAEEVIDLCDDNKKKTNQINEESDITAKQSHEVLHNIAIKEEKLRVVETETAAVATRNKSVVTEESFAEEISASIKSETEKQKFIGETEPKNAVASTKNYNDNRNIAETGFGEESSVAASQASNSKMSLNIESPIVADAHTENPQPDTLVESETETGRELLLKTKSKSLVEPAAEAKQIERDVNAQNSNEYKPIVEDITLESSLIENETKANADNKLHKQVQLDANIEGSVIEEMLESEEDTKTSFKEPADGEQVSTSSKDNNEMPASATNKILTSEENSTNIEEKEDTFVVESESDEKSFSNLIDVELLCAKNIELSNDATQTPHLQKEMQCVEMQEDVSEPKSSKAVPVNEKDSESLAKYSLPTNYDRKVEENLDDTNKLLEEIEDVLNKSDEIKQKQLNEIEESSDKPLTEEFESEQFPQEKVEQITELKGTGNLLQNFQELLDPVPLSNYETSYNDNPEEEISPDIVAVITSNTSVTSQTSIVTAIMDSQQDSSALDNGLVASEPQSKLQNVNEEQGDINDGSVVGTENTQQNDKILDVQIIDNKSIENEPAATKSSDSESLNVNIIMEMDNNSKQSASINKNVENIPIINPRRSTRRASQSIDVLEIAATELPVTPRRSTRRSSMSTEPTTTPFTPAKRASRRASLSIANDTPLTPKPITKRRVSISVDDDDTPRPSTSKLQQRAKTPRKQLEQSLIIPEENNEMYPIIMEGEEAEQNEIKFDDEKNTHQGEVKEVEAEIEQCTEKYKTEATKQIEVVMEEHLKCNVGQAHFEDNLPKLELEVDTDLESKSADERKLDEDPFEELTAAEKSETIENENLIIDEKLSEFQPVEEMAQSINEQPADNVTNTCSLEDMKELECSPYTQLDKGKVEDSNHTATIVNVLESLESDTSTKGKKRVTILADSPKTPLMTGVRVLLKTPKPATQTPRLAGIRNLVLTPKNTEETEAEEVEKLAAISDLVKTPEVSTSTTDHITADLQRTALDTPKLAGIRVLMKTPKSSSECVQEENDKLSMMAKLLKTPEYSTLKQEMPSSSMKGVKELLKTPKNSKTPHLKGVRELMKTPKATDTPNISGLKELLETPMQQTHEDMQVSNVGMKNVDIQPEELPSSTSQNEANLTGIKELLQTPKVCSTPRRKSVRELTKTPKISSTHQKDKELEMYLRTPTAKDIMIPTMPSSAVIEKSGGSIEISTEYDLNSSNEVESTNIEELFKTPVASSFAQRLAAGSYYDEEKADEEEETLQGDRNDTAEEAFDKLIGQESQVQTPIRKRYARKSITIQTPTCSSPFTAADILSDLPKTDVEEWIENLSQAEPPPMTECEDDGEEVELNQETDITTMDTSAFSSVENSDQHSTLNESIIPETCTKIFITEKSLQDKSTASLTYAADTRDPLLNTCVELKERGAFSPVTSIEAEISGINLLDQTLESAQDESSLLDEALFVDEPSVFDEPLVVSDDNASEGERILNFSRNNPEVTEGPGNDLSEPLMVSDSEDLNLSQERVVINTTKPKTDNDAQESSMLEKTLNKVDLLAEDPLETEDNYKLVAGGERNTTIETKHYIQNEADSTYKTVVAESSESKEEVITISEEEQKSFVEIVGESHGKVIIIADDAIVPESSEKPIEGAEKDTTIFNVDINSTIENIDAEVDAAETVSDQTVYEDTEKSPLQKMESKEIAIEETKVISTESEDIFVDNYATEICEETNILNDEKTDVKESTRKVTENKREGECQDIFMNNSNIDESFADEAVNDEGNATTTKASIEENEQQAAIVNAKSSNEAALSETLASKGADTDPSTSIEHSGNMQFDMKTISDVVNITSEENSTEFEVERISVAAIETLPKEVAPNSTASIEELVYVENKSVRDLTTLSDKSLIDSEEKILEYSEVVDGTVEKESTHVVSEIRERCMFEDENQPAKEETEEKTNTTVKKEPSTDVSTNECVSNPSLDVQTLSVDSTEDTKSSEIESAEDQNTKTIKNTTPESENASDENKAADNNILDNKLITISSDEEISIISEKSSQTSENTENASQEIVELTVQQISSTGSSTSDELINTATEIVKYDFEIKINESNCLEEAASASQIERVETSEVVHDIVSKADDQHQITDENHIKEMRGTSKALQEMSQDEVSAVKAGRKKRTVSENLQESTQEAETRKGYRRDRRKVVETHIEEKLEEFVEDQPTDTISESVKEDLKSNRKRTTSESSHGSVESNDAERTKTRRGGRRKIENTAHVPIVEEEELEIIIIEGLDDKTEANVIEPKAESKDNYTEAAQTAAITEIREQQDRIEERENETANKIPIDPSQEQKLLSNIAESQATHSDEISKLDDDQSIDDNTTHKAKGTNEKEASDQTVTAVAGQEETVEASVEETDQVSPDVTEQGKPLALESNQDIASQYTETSEKVNSKAEKTLEEADKPEQMTHKRSRRTPALIESSQSSQFEDGNTRSRRNRRIIQKATEEEAVATESIEAKQGAVPNVVSHLISDKTDGILSEAKETSKSSTSSHGEPETKALETVSLAVIEPPQKRTRRKINISESSVEIETSRTRRGGRKVQKAVVEEIEEECKDNSSEINKNKVSVDRGEVELNIHQENEASQSAETVENINKHEPKLNTESLEHVHEASAKESSSEHGESQESISRHGKTTPALQETVAEEVQTTSRKGRQKAVVSATELLAVGEDSEINTPQVEQAEQKEQLASTIDHQVEESNDEKVTTNMDSSPKKTGKRGKQHKIDVSKVINEDEQSEKETSTKQTTKRARQRKVDDTKEMNLETTAVTVATSLTTRRAGRQKKENAEIAASPLVHKGRNANRYRKTPVEHITGDSQEEQISTSSKSANQILDERRPITPNEMEQPVVEEVAKERKIGIDLKVTPNEYESNRETVLSCDAEHLQEKDKPTKRPVKSTHSPQSKCEAIAAEKTNKSEIVHELTNVSLEQEADNKNVSHQDEKKTDVDMKPQKATKRKAAAKQEMHDTHFEKPVTKSRRRKMAEDVIEPKNEDAVLSEVKTSDVDVASKEQLDQHQTSSQEENQVVEVNQRPMKVAADESPSSEAVAQHIKNNQAESSAPTKRRRVGRTKQVAKDHENEEELVTPETTTATEIYKKSYDTAEEREEESKQSGGRRRNIGKKKVENKDIKPSEENKKISDEATDITHHNMNVSNESQQPQEEPKRGRSRKNKTEQQEESKDPATAHSPVAKSRGRKRKEINSDVSDCVSKERKEDPSENTEQQLHETTESTAPTAKKNLKIIEHITAESQEPEDTPARRARNVPQRKAATAYHNYDETSDSETKSKTKKKADTPRKSLEAAKKSPIVATITSTSIVSVSPSSTPVITTARGRTRKPTAKVQQYLEEERAKAETPKKRALLAVAAANVVDAATPQRTPAKRGRKPSATIETGAEGTPQASKGRGRAKAAVILPAQKEETSVLPAAAAATTSVEEQSADFLQATASTESSIKPRVGGSKAKIDEETPSTDAPPAKKSHLELECEKPDPLPFTDHPTPTRIAGRRNAAAAAKARIEEDALASIAAIEPPKRARAKKVAQKVSTQLTANTVDTDNHSTTEAEEEHSLKTDEKEVKNKNTAPKKRGHRLASASTVEGDDELDTGDTTSNKKGRKPAINATDSPPGPAKRSRKPKIVADNVADPKTPAESKTTKGGRGRGRKNVHFDELGAEAANSSQQNEADVKAAPADTSEPVKRGTRPRRK